jgi:hypothetical protein
MEAMIGIEPDGNARKGVSVRAHTWVRPYAMARRCSHCANGTILLWYHGSIPERSTTMDAPFPGMDPYLELPSLWPDVHASLIGTIRDQLQQQIVPKYFAQITPYVALEQLSIEAPRRSLVPNVAIYERDMPHGSTLVAVAHAPPLVGVALMEVPTRYARIEIRALSDERLVTVIEVLSPVNKRPGPDGADGYEKKRQELMNNGIHLLELDLLRAGRRPLLGRPEKLPPQPYFAFLSRVERWPEIAIWPCSLQKPLPNLPVPLRAPDPDAVLALTPVMQQIYRNARYDLRVDYRAEPPAPELLPEEAAWLDAHLRERGLR